jgi:DNA or RNA helicases of superfamily II
MENKSIQVTYSGTVKVNKSRNPRELYEHQGDAMAALNKIDEKKSFDSLLVLPTGGGKTLTACYWLLKNAADKNKKIIWIAHRHLLLEQAAETFQKNAYSDLLINNSSFTFRIVSGKHDKAINIKQTDDILIASKDSIAGNLKALDKWLKDEDEIYFVIDEAHHATAKTYRNIIDYIKSKVENVKLLGLTATPFRTSEVEKGLLKKIFTDDIIYKIDLKDLIKKGILSRPQFEECSTDIVLGEGMGLKAMKSIEQLDSIPDDIANMIADNKERNNKIVKHYVENKKTYGQTLVFALNRMHAFALRGIFEKYGVKAAVIVSGTTAEFIGIEISDTENTKNIEEYRNGKIQVLINVNILTEGVDLPQTKTVFLTRPTVSSILMTQMVGRALRGEAAGGTKEAYIVSFVDEWQERIAWVNAENLIEDEEEFIDNSSEYEKRAVRLISIQKIEEFAKIVDDTVDTSKLENIDFIKRVPIGMYTFSFIDTDNIGVSMERNYQVLVYNSTKKQYEEMIKSLPELFDEYKIDKEVIDEKTLNEICEAIEETYFYKDMLPSYDEKDIKSILKYYAQKECSPDFKTFDEIDRNKLDLLIYAKEIVEKDMRRSEQNAFIDSLWDDEQGIIRIYFNKKLYFTRQLETEINKLEGNGPICVSEPEVKFDEKSIEEMSLYYIQEHFPEEARKIKDTIFNKYKNERGQYTCNECGKPSNIKALFQIDHIKPMAKGGRTIIENLQLLCRKCNQIKGDRYE